MKKVTDSGKERLSQQELREFLAESAYLKAALISKYVDHAIAAQSKSNDLYQKTIKEITAMRWNAEQAKHGSQLTLVNSRDSLETKKKQLFPQLTLVNSWDSLDTKNE